MKQDKESFHSSLEEQLAINATLQRNFSQVLTEETSREAEKKAQDEQIAFDKFTREMDI